MGIENKCASNCAFNIDGDCGIANTVLYLSSLRSQGRMDSFNPKLIDMLESLNWKLPRFSKISMNGVISFICAPGISKKSAESTAGQECLYFENPEYPTDRSLLLEIKEMRDNNWVFPMGNNEEGSFSGDPDKLAQILLGRFTNGNFWVSSTNN